jgi:CHAT domain-containing protein/tetratricopeptide (TPR) repeat protein
VIFNAQKADAVLFANAMKLGLLACLLALWLPQGQGEALLGEGYKAKLEGRQQDAKAAFLKAADALEAENAKPERIASAHKGAGDSAMDLNDFVLAEAQYRRAVEWRRKIGDDLTLADYLLDYHRALRSLGRFDEGYVQALEAAKLKETKGASVENLIAVYATLADDYYWDQRWSDSLVWGRKRYELSHKTAPNSLDEEGALHGLCEPTRNSQGAKAEQELIEARIRILQQVAPMSTRLANAFMYMADNLRMQGNREGDKYIEQSAQLFARCSSGSQEHSWALHRLAALRVEQRRFDEALAAAQQSWTIYRRWARNRPGEIIRSTTAVGDFGVRGFDIMQVYTACGHPELAVELLQEIQGRELSRKMVMQQRLTDLSTDTAFKRYEQATDLTGKATQELAAKALALGFAKNDLEKQKEKGGDTAKEEAALERAQKDLDAQQAKVADLEAKGDAVWQDLRRRNPKLFAPVYPLADCVKYLPKGSAYLGYFIGYAPKVNLMYIGPSGRPQLFTLDKDVFELRELVNSVRSKLIARNASVYTDLANLFKTLVPKQIRAEIEQSMRLVITPDGALWELPFSALIAGEGAPYYLGLTKSITITPSLSLFGLAQVAGDQKAKPQQVRASVFGDPVFSREGKDESLSAQGDRGALWVGDRPPSRLPGTAREASAIAGLYDTKAITGEDVAEATVRRSLETSDLVHIATHGYVNNDYPLASGLLLTAPKRPAANYKEDGALLSWEILQQMKLSPSLVVLSACETGLGRSLRAEGVDGLIRAFQVSGVPSVVCYVWKVYDASPVGLITEFNRQVRAGADYDEAIRYAMCKVSSNEATRDPYFWAPFFLTGDQRNKLFERAK